MPWTTRLVRPAALAISLLGLLSTVPEAYAADNQRREWLQKYDEDGDKRLKGKEAKNFMKDHEKKHEQLMKFCENAMEKPQKHDVTFPKGEKEKKFKCKKKRIDAPYMKAWVRAGAPEEEEEKPVHPSERDDKNVRERGD